MNQFSNQSSEQLEKAAQGLLRACEDAQATCHNSMDAAIEANAALAKGCEEFGRKFGTLMKESMSRMLDTGRTMMSAKNIKEVSDLQSEFLKDAFDRWVAGTSRLSEISARMAQDAFEPVSRHVNEAMTKAAQKANQSRAA